MKWHQTPIPVLHPTKSGRMMAPDYGSGLHPIAIKPAEWLHLVSARFGPGRLCGLGATRWTGDSYRYDIFSHLEDNHIALRWWNGGGEGWLISPDRHDREEQSLLRHIANIKEETIRWDFCHFLWETAEKSRLAGERQSTHEFTTAFLEQRLKRRRYKGRTRVEIVPRTNTDQTPMMI